MRDDEQAGTTGGATARDGHGSEPARDEPTATTDRARPSVFRAVTRVFMVLGLPRDTVRGDVGERPAGSPG